MSVAGLKRAIFGEAAAATDRRRGAREQSATIRGRLGPAEPVETVATMLAETPADVVAALQRRWPDVWRRVLAAARRDRVLPAGLMIHALELGLDALETKDVRP